MDEGYVLSLVQNALYVCLELAGPILLVSLVIGGIISLVQSVTQINEVTLNFIPKIIGIAAVLLILGSWMLQQLLSFTSGLINNLPNLVH
jgi:flagellar biosynthetic protein FliQ